MLLFFVGPLVLFVRFGLKFSDETYEPRYQPRTYRTSFRDFFLTMESGLAIFLIIMGLLFIRLLTKPIINQSGQPDWTAYGILGLLTLMLFGVSVYILVLDLNYWEHTKDRVLIFDPEARTLIVHTDEGEYIIVERGIERVDIFSNQNHRNLREYYLFKLRDGRKLIITDKTKGAYAIFDFFNDIPEHRHKRLIPTISPANSETG
ncbi:hypothetical protein [Persicitalea jodogahamensis]|uniref:PH domain-containing protein n=1 Tax=Persicitalea jodogahamensis TaxID=402147 RepID=A0A8J3GAM7_9BACT|nr:hypothetical protein [Persicitalea jodogahamensis]GHB71226.1 hypothetical protein GCM10007390_26260 [Persicitalea jodogahamensis]